MCLAHASEPITWVQIQVSARPPFPNLQNGDDVNNGACFQKVVGKDEVPSGL